MANQTIDVVRNKRLETMKKSVDRNTRSPKCNYQPTDTRLAL